MIRLISASRLVGVDVEAVRLGCCFAATFFLFPEQPQLPISVILKINIIVFSNISFFNNVFLAY
jgi:hypothetical protein